ncbi:MAG: 23S rRNA (cytosine(1962)-C(5))-methyltransferase RlmI, partial [Myxococcota bacterium]
MTDLVLQPGRDRSVRRRHPWLLSGSVERIAGEVSPGDEVRVLSSAGEVLAWGHVSPGSKLRVRLFAFGKEEPPGDWLEQRVAAAVARRQNDPLLAGTDAVRLVNAEGDGLPGLVADRYGDLVVVRPSAAGVLVRAERVAAALRAASGAGRGYLRADVAAARREGVAAAHGALWGEAPEAPVEIVERGRHYQVDPVAGQ